MGWDEMGFYYILFYVCCSYTRILYSILLFIFSLFNDIHIAGLAQRSYTPLIIYEIDFAQYLY